MLQGCRRRVGHCGADSPAHHNHCAVVLDLRGFAERADHVENLIAGFQRVEQVSGLSRGLYDDIDGAVLGIGVLNGDRNTLALFVDTKDDELAGPLFTGDARRFDNEAFDSGC